MAVQEEESWLPRLLMIGRKLNKADIKDLAFLYQEVIPIKEYDKGQLFIQVLIDEKIITKTNLKKLEISLNVIGRYVLAEEISKLKCTSSKANIKENNGILTRHSKWILLLYKIAVCLKQESIDALYHLCLNFTLDCVPAPSPKNEPHKAGLQLIRRLKHEQIISPTNMKEFKLRLKCVCESELVEKTEEYERDYLEVKDAYDDKFSMKISLNNTQTRSGFDANTYTDSNEGLYNKIYENTPVAVFPVAKIFTEIESNVTTQTIMLPKASEMFHGNEELKIKRKSGEENTETDGSETNKFEASEYQTNKSEASEFQTNKSEASESQTNKSEASEYQTNEFEASEYQTNKSEASEYQTNKSEASESETNKSKTSESETNKSESGESETNKSEASESETNKSKASKSETNKSKASESETNKSEASKSETTESVASESETNKSKASEYQTNKSKASESETNKSEASESETNKSEASESETSESETNKSEASESETNKSEASESETNESETSESETNKSEASESHTNKSEASESRASERDKSTADKSIVGEYYPMPNNPCGRCIIFSNEFKGMHGFKERVGTDIDSNRLKKLFKWLRFEVQVCTSYSAEEMKNKLDLEADNQDNQYRDCFVTFILSHGENGAVYGNDGNIVTIKEIKELIKKNGRASLLDNKPKLIFIQACQRTGDDNAIKLPDNDSLPEEPAIEHGKTFSWSNIHACISKLVNRYASSTIEASQRTRENNAVKLLDNDSSTTEEPAIEHDKIFGWSNIHADIAVYSSSIEGFRSYRKSKGSLFIQVLCDVFEKDAGVSRLYDLMLKVNDKVSKVPLVFNGKSVSQMPSVKELTLRKAFRFKSISGNFKGYEDNYPKTFNNI